MTGVAGSCWIGDPERRLVRLSVIAGHWLCGAGTTQPHPFWACMGTLGRASGMPVPGARDAKGTAVPGHRRGPGSRRRTRTVSPADQLWRPRG